MARQKTQLQEGYPPSEQLAVPEFHLFYPRFGDTSTQARRHAARGSAPRVELTLPVPPRTSRKFPLFAKAEGAGGQMQAPAAV